ncbi:MAG: squalene/phytoene synthase family protein [Alphaproteobacteria bacterium]
MTTPSTAITDLVRRYDLDRARAALLAPDPVREALMAVYAFNIELAHIAGQVNEPQLGEIRLQWWRDAISKEGDNGGHPVAEALANARTAHNLSADLLHAMIDARSFDIARAPMPSMEALRAYLCATTGNVFALAGQICAPHTEPPQLEALAGHAAIAHGLTGLMRVLPLHASRGQMYLPADHLAKHGVNVHDLLRGQESPELRNALQLLRETALAELNLFSAAFAKMDRAALPAFLPLALVKPQLRVLASSRHRPLRDVAEVNPMGRVWSVWWAHFRGRL